MPGWSWVLVAGVAYVFFWCVLIFSISLASGWSSLAEVYSAPGPFHGTRRRFRSIRLGTIWNYNNSVTVGTNADGLYLALMFPFRAGHPPLFIPWGDVSATVAKGWVFTYLDFRFAKVPSVRIRVLEALGRQIAADANQSWGGGEATQPDGSRPGGATDSSQG